MKPGNLRIFLQGAKTSKPQEGVWMIRGERNSGYILEFAWNFAASPCWGVVFYCNYFDERRVSMEKTKGIEVEEKGFSDFFDIDERKLIISGCLFKNEALALHALLDSSISLNALDPWLPFPQRECSFAFGDGYQPIPIGCLGLLWEQKGPFVQECPNCGKQTYVIAFSGLLTIGGARLVCPSCATAFWDLIEGGLVGVAQYLRSGPLRGTVFEPKAMVLGSSFSSNGKDLLGELGVDIEKDDLEERETWLWDGFTFDMEIPDLPKVLLGCHPSLLLVNPPFKKPKT